MIHEETQVGAEASEESGLFTSLAEELIAEHSRLAALADRCRVDGERLAAREAAFRERERALEASRRELEQEARELSRWRDELHEKLCNVEQREARVASAQEQEARLAELGNQLLVQFGSALPVGENEMS